MFSNLKGKEIRLRGHGENPRLPLVNFFLLLVLLLQVVFMISSFQKGRGLMRGAAPGGLVRCAASNC